MRQNKYIGSKEVTTISDRIFDLLAKRGMTQKEFSLKTGIAQSTISDWKKKRNNPTSDKILIICEILEVSPYELLSGTENKARRDVEVYVIDRHTSLGEMVELFQGCNSDMQNRILGYMEAMKNFQKK